ncbi:MAG TPA: hypothetical protein VK501_15430 [Baekduia sp.]|uniref:hypothetical protein n=1 Tax=Baekduia sp. TaxID=2600305 RepID=UPI002D111304|nr:hypothetical protein [Baekduia sp.]HMJ35301.1 hypothetical protein [Baekduia sp.]
MAISVAALLCLAAVALAQTSSNVYSVTGKIASGGTKAKPKHVGVVFNYKISTPDSTLTSPVKTYKIHFDGLKYNTKGVAKGKYCTAASINAAASDAGCAAATKVGTGQVNAFVGAAGGPVDPGAKCNLKLDIYAGGPKSLALFLHGTPPDCIAQINQAIDAKLSTDATGGSLTFTVPPTLLHPVTGLDSGITSVSSTIAKGSGTKGVFTSTGCKSTRKVTVTFTAEDGATSTADAKAGKC